MVIMSTSLVQCQINANIISENEFNNIKINNVTLSAIKATEGNENQVQNLFSSIILEKDINTGERGPSNYWFKYNGFEIALTDSAGTPNHPGIAMFEITNNNWSFTIQERTITIGDNINLLGNIVFNSDKNGDKSIVYQYCYGCNNFIYIDFNQDTNLITEIGYIEQI